MEFVHKSVLFDEAIESLNIDKSKIILDGTAGGGGHSREIAKRAGRLIAVDQDPDAIKVLHERLDSFDNVTIVQNNFSNVKDILKEQGIEKIDGMLLDLGVSSFQLDTAQRGFSYHADAPLDMRMSKSGLSAKDVVNTYSEAELADILFRYGEEKFARRIAKNIVLHRQNKEIETTGELVDIIKESYPKAKMRDSHPARKTFQAIRIEVNAELDALEKTLDSALDCLSSGGRLSIITFHSLEDRMVKEKFNSWVNPCTCPKEFPVCVCGKKPLGKMPFKFKAPSEAELEKNPRARSSKLRCFEKF
ncbi:MAG: 16S rRNA (cytosine(1402)-N(4))-methyltransferase RsmH [Clostridiales bacterium]|nr:16S rRNA (cytosine(1402)-N(4))-methyltransferase RsmH [Clostridiales bacterium]MBD8930026.1 16S rRNA (cytosine(1402)-N(4))-methyltransferase RsmH [Clostridiales bacterium]MBD8930074.1 16S rRNA (cytosine(1402)-N(4))-methyltransferase RsmH [Clostridiales bacterium]